MLIVKLSLYLEGIDLLKKELKYEIKNLEIIYDKIKKKEILFIYPI